MKELSADPFSKKIRLKKEIQKRSKRAKAKQYIGLERFENLRERGEIESGFFSKYKVYSSVILL